MEEGSFRVDANISVRRRGEKGLRNKIEIKNMNSFSNMEMALEAEIKRQIREYTANPGKPPREVIQQATYRWDPEKKETVLMRRKEQADDYRYFPEPDLVPIVLTDAYIEEIRASLARTAPCKGSAAISTTLSLSPDPRFLFDKRKAIVRLF